MFVDSLWMQKPIARGSYSWNNVSFRSSREPEVKVFQRKLSVVGQTKMLVTFQCRGTLCYWIIARQGSIVLTVGAGALF